LICHLKHKFFDFLDKLIVLHPKVELGVKKSHASGGQGEIAWRMAFCEFPWTPQKLFIKLPSRFFASLRG
jgi:hypothetical protein